MPNTPCEVSDDTVGKKTPFDYQEMNCQQNKDCAKLLSSSGQARAHMQLAQPGTKHRRQPLS
jgi:hypothetical protein